MAIDWGYSKLSHSAKQNGGPEKYLAKIAKYNYQQGMKAGKKSQTPIIVGAIIVGGLVVEGIHKAPKIIEFCKSNFGKDEIKEEEVKEAEEILIRGMKAAEEIETNDTNTTEGDCDEYKS